MTKINTLWTEEFRPTKLADYLGNTFLKEFIADCIEKNDIPHLLLQNSTPGTGKTTLAKLIVKNINCDYIYINASKERNIDTVKETITQFASTASFRPIKIVILDEADFMNPNSTQPALRGVMEDFSAKTRFILTCNYAEKIIEPLRSRCQEFVITPPSMKMVATHVRNILDTKQVKYDLNDLGYIINSCFPDIRKIINTCQKFTIGNELKTPEIASADIIEIIELIKKKKWRDVRQYLVDNEVRDYSFVYRGIYDNIDKFPEQVEAQISILLAEYQYKASSNVDLEINVNALIAQIIKLC